jgi:hypothetical protein
MNVTKRVDVVHDQYIHFYIGLHTNERLHISQYGGVVLSALAPHETAPWQTSTSPAARCVKRHPPSIFRLARKSVAIQLYTDCMHGWFSGAHCETERLRWPLHKSINRFLQAGVPMANPNRRSATIRFALALVDNKEGIGGEYPT